MATHPYRQRLGANSTISTELPSSSEADYSSGTRSESIVLTDYALYNRNAISSPCFSGDRPLNLNYFSSANGRFSAASPNFLYVSEASSVPGLILDGLQTMAPESLLSQSEPDLPAASYHAGGLGHNRSVSSSLSLFKADGPHMHFIDQSVVKQHLGNNSTNLKSRLEASEQYRRNARKSNDPKVLFHYAQFMLQMALELKELDLKPTDGAAAKASHSRSLSDVSSSSRRQSSLNLSGLNEYQAQRAFFLREAQHYLKRLSDKGYVEAQYLLGDGWSSGAFGKVDDEKAFSLFLVSAKHGHVESAFRVAHCYEEGLGTGRDARKGIEFLKKAASEKHPAAMYKLGVYHFYARMGIPDTMTNKKMGINWLERASIVATELTAAAPYELGKIYYEGYKDIVIRDHEYAVRLFTKAAALNHVEAAARLGEHYEEGVDGLPTDHLSINYYTQAALLGHPGAMLALGAWYLCGAECLEISETEALLWIEKSAACGYPKAQCTYGHFLQNGKGCKSDPKLAQEMFVKAAQGGYERALKRIDDKDLSAKLAKRIKKSGKTSMNKDDEDGKCNFM